MSSLICLLLLVQNPLSNQTKIKPVLKPTYTEKITLQKLDTKDLAYLIQILNVDQFQKYKK